MSVKVTVCPADSRLASWPHQPEDLGYNPRIFGGLPPLKPEDWQKIPREKRQPRPPTKEGEQREP